MTTLIGGEMLLWSDLDGKHGPAPAGGPALATLLATLSATLPASAQGRTLVAGPHEPALLDAIRADDVTVLVRGVADAEALERPGITIWCGSLEKIATVPAFDTVVALDGLDRLCSAEADAFSPAEILGRLLAVLRPGGRLLLGTENLFGLHRLIALPPEPADTDWVRPDNPDPVRPGEALTRAGLSVVREYAAYPAPRAPAVLLGPEILAEPSLAGFVGATLAEAVSAEGAVLADPVRLVTGALAHGLAAALAPAWVLLAEKPGGTNVGARWPDAVVAVGGAVRLADAGDLPRGRTLEELLLAACRRRDLPALRELLTGWQAGPAAGVPAGRVVVDAGGHHAALATAGEPLLALRAFAATVIDGGYAELWPAPAGEAELTALLAGMTGRELRPADVPPAPAAGLPGLAAVRELTMARDRLTRELADARAKHEWYENMLVTREGELKRERQINTVLRATLPGRAATTLAGGLRAGKRALRAVVRRPRG
jgi:hypothetical protein